MTISTSNNYSNKLDIKLPYNFIYNSQAVQKMWDDTSNPILSEDHVLSLIDAIFPSQTLHTPRGRGDDCAELVLGKNIVLSSDFFWQDLHFRKSYFTPYEVGAKALGRAVSDLAAAGAKPLGFSLGLMLPRGISTTAVSSLFEGMQHMASSCDIVLSGGDTSSNDMLGFSITVWGESLYKNFFLHRKQALESDIIFSIGGIGLANAGLSLLEKGGREAVTQWPELCHAHLSMKPLLHEGMVLASFAHTHPNSRIGLMDLSDGLIKDVPRLIGNFGAKFTYPIETIPKIVRNYAYGESLDPNFVFLKGGEDYALIGTCKKEYFPLLVESLPSTVCLGEVVKEVGTFYEEKPITLKGFDHFSP